MSLVQVQQEEPSLSSFLVISFILLLILIRSLNPQCHFCLYTAVIFFSFTWHRFSLISHVYIAHIQLYFRHHLFFWIHCLHNPLIFRIYSDSSLNFLFIKSIFGIIFFFYFTYLIKKSYFLINSIHLCYLICYNFVKI